MLFVSMLRMLGGGTAGVCACTARQPASAKDNPATGRSHFFMSAHLQGARSCVAGSPTADRTSYSDVLPLQPACPHAQSRSCVFSIGSHSVLQYLPDVVTHEQTGGAHFSAFAGAIFS